MKQIQRALIVGASRGVGREVALRLAQDGVQTLLVARNGAGLEQLVVELHKVSPQTLEHMPIPLDVFASDGLNKLCDILQNNEIDYCLHNVGGSSVRDPLCSFTEISETIRINLQSAVEVNRVLIPKMQRRGFGRIVHISSNAAVKPLGSAAYSIAKSALNSYIQRVGREVIGSGVSLTGLMPGPIGGEGSLWAQRLMDHPQQTADFISKNIPSGKFHDPADLAELVMNLFTAAALTYSGTVLNADGGM